MAEFTDDKVVHVCRCGWRGRWDEAFSHVVETLGEEGHYIDPDLEEKPSK